MAQTPDTPSAARSALRRWVRAKQSLQGTTQNACAEQIGILPSTLSRVLSGKTPDLDTAALIERETGIAAVSWVVLPRRRAS